MENSNGPGFMKHTCRSVPDQVVLSSSDSARSANAGLPVSKM